MDAERVDAACFDDADDRFGEEEESGEGGAAPRSGEGDSLVEVDGAGPEEEFSDGDSSGADAEEGWFGDGEEEGSSCGEEDAFEEEDSAVISSGRSDSGATW